MMEQRTLDIIHICKGNTKYNLQYESVYRSIREYMADECMVKPSYYTDKDIDYILWEVMQDYIDHCDKPSFFMWCLKDVMDRYNWEIYSAIAVVFGVYTRVRNENGYVNGFDDRIHRLDKEEL